MTRLSPHLNADYDLPVPQIDMADGVPRARDFDDSYYNADDGLAETRQEQGFIVIIRGGFFQGRAISANGSWEHNAGTAVPR